MSFWTSPIEQISYLLSVCTFFPKQSANFSTPKSKNKIKKKPKSQIYLKTNPKCQNAKYFVTIPNNNSELEYDDPFGIGVRVRSTLSTLSLDQSPVCFHSIIYRNSYRLGSDSCHVLTSAFNSSFGKMIKSPLSILASATVLVIEPLLIENISCSTSLPKIVVIVSCPCFQRKIWAAVVSFLWKQVHVTSPTNIINIVILEKNVHMCTYYSYCFWSTFTSMP